MTNGSHSVSGEHLLSQSMIDRSAPTVASFCCAHCGVHSRHIIGLITDMKTGTLVSGDISDKNCFYGAKCDACWEVTLFAKGRQVYPSSSTAPQAHSDMPEEVKIDFEEARQIFSVSPRGAAALLRLCVEKLCKTLGANSKNINDAIGDLVSSGKITPLIQKALDYVRVIGNNSVHPGSMDIDDDNDTVMALFKLINIIVEKTISDPKEIDDLFQSIPKEKRDHIDKRDGKYSN